MTDIDKLLNAICMPNFMGRAFIATAIEMGIQDIDSVDLITKWAYRDIARQFGVSYEAVERDIRHTIKIWWGNGGGLVCSWALWVEFSKRPSNKRFLMAMVDVLR